MNKIHNITIGLFFVTVLVLNPASARDNTNQHPVKESGISEDRKAQ